MTLLRERWHSTIGEHRVSAGKLEPPFRQIPSLVALDGARDLLPELLWFDAIVRFYPRGVSNRHIESLRAAFDTVKKTGQGILGMISEFALPLAEQAKVLAVLSAEQRDEVFPSPFRDAMAMYPEFPGHFLIGGLDLPAKPEDAIEWVRESVLRLFDRHSESGAYANAVLVGGLFRAGRISIPKEGTDDLVAALLAYPLGTKDLNSHVEGFARSSINAMSDSLLPADHAWAKHFWRTNRRLTTCRPWV